MAISKSQIKLLYYLNMQEIQHLSNKYNIPINIYIEENGKLKKTSQKDRKINIISHLIYFLKYNKTPKPTIIGSKAIKKEPLIIVNEKAKIHYGQYDKKNLKLFSYLKQKTQNKFKDGAIARFILLDFWTKNKAPSIKEFIDLWLKEFQNPRREHPEWAYLTDLESGLDMTDWKKQRALNAKIAMSLFK